MVNILIPIIVATCLQLGNGQTDPIAHHVVHIGIDGLRPDCIELAPGGAPNILTRFRSEGTSTLTLARTVTRATSAPGWSATLTSMPPELTGVKSNLWSPAWLDPEDTTYPETHLTPVMGNRETFPTVFKVIEDQAPDVETAAFYSWGFFDYMTEEGYPGLVDHVVKCDESYNFCDQNLTDTFVQYLPNVFNNAEKSYSFIYIGDVDNNGHFSLGGWCGSQYSDVVAAADLQVGQILDAVDSSGNGDVVVLLSTDHGGEGWLHGKNQDTSLRIPMFIKGPGIKQNYEFTYKVRNMDMVPTAVRVLGLEPSLWWEGTVMQEAFEDGVL